MIVQKIAEIMFNYHGNMCSLNCILYQLGIRNGEKADELGKKHFFKAMEAYELTSLKFKRKIFKKACKRDSV